MSINVGDFIEIKRPIIHLGNDYGYTIWFYDHDRKIVSLDDYSCNYPRWALATWSKEGMLVEAQKLLDGDKEMISVEHEFENLLNF